MVQDMHHRLLMRCNDHSQVLKVWASAWSLIQSLLGPQLSVWKELIRHVLVHLLQVMVLQCKHAIAF